MQKDDKKAPIVGTADWPHDTTTNYAEDIPPPNYIFPAKESEYVPKSERLLAIYDLLTDKSFPRKGAGKSTKPKILDAIIDAAMKIKLKLQGDL